MQTYRDKFIAAMLGIMFFIVFQPFEFPDGWMRYVTIVLFTLISMIVVLTSELIVQFLFRLPHDLSKGWDYLIKRNRIFVPVNVTLLTFSIATLFWLMDTEKRTDYFSLSSLSYLVLCLLCISIMQSLYWRSIYNSRILAGELEEAQRINGILQERERLRKIYDQKKDETPVERNICIQGTTKELLEVSIDQLLFVESSGNYVSVHYIKGEKLAIAEIRTSMKEVESLLEPYPQFMRCHRAFMVNLDFVVDVDRRTSGFLLSLRDCQSKVPVSKSFQQEVKMRLQNPD